MVFYEAPHRIEKCLRTMLEVFGDRQICLARELTKKHEEFIRGTIEEVLEIVDDLKGEMVIVVEAVRISKMIEKMLQYLWYMNRSSNISMGD